MVAKSQKVYPVPGVFLVGEPMTVHEVETKGRADELVKTGHFAFSQSEADSLSLLSKEAIAEQRAAEAPADDVAEVAAPEDKADNSPPDSTDQE